MKIPINLASQPFRRDRGMLVASVALCVVLMLTLGGLGYLYSLDEAQGSAVRLEIAKIDRRISRAQKDQAALDAILHKPENAMVLERSVFINTLIYHKAISWSQLFSDLETTIPYNVKLMALVPSVTTDNKVVLDITVAADKPEAMLEFVRALEKSKAFRNVIPHNTHPPAQSEPFYSTLITVNYVHAL